MPTFKVCWIETITRVSTVEAENENAIYDMDFKDQTNERVSCIKELGSETEISEIHNLDTDQKILF